MFEHVAFWIGGILCLMIVLGETIVFLRVPIERLKVAQSITGTITALCLAGAYILAASRSVSAGSQFPTTILYFGVILLCLLIIPYCRAIARKLRVTQTFGNKE